MWACLSSEGTENVRFKRRRVCLDRQFIYFFDEIANSFSRSRRHDPFFLVFCLRGTTMAHGHGLRFQHVEAAMLFSRPRRSVGFYGICHQTGAVGGEVVSSCCARAYLEIN